MPARRKGGTPSPRKKKKARLVREPGFVYKIQLSLSNEVPDCRRPERGRRSSYP